MPTKKITFENEEGHELSARLDLPLDRNPEGYAIFAHCFTCSKDLSTTRNVSRALTENGYGVMRFDFTGLGDSEGDFSETNFSSNVQDLLAAADWLRQNHAAPAVLIGHSLGGAAVLYAAAELSEVQAVVTIGAPADPGHVSHLFSDSLEQIKTTGKAEVTLAGRKFTLRKQFVEDIMSKDLHSVVGDLGKSLLIFHSPQDSIVGIENARILYDAAKHPKSFVSLDGADHLLSNKDDAIYVGNVLAEWVRRYVEISEQPELEVRKRVAARIGHHGYTTELRAGRHTFKADEPASAGGDNLGPTPYDLLLSSLGSCTAMTLRMYADRKGWQLDSVEVHLSHRKEHNYDCENCEKQSSKIDLIEREIILSGQLDDVQRSRLMEIADKCPVHRTLTGDIEVRTTQVKDQN